MLPSSRTPAGHVAVAPVHVAPLHSYSARIDTLAPAALIDFIHAQLDRSGLPHSTFSEDASLAARSLELGGS